MNQQNMDAQISEHYGPGDPVTDVVMGVAVMKDFTFGDSRLSRTLTKARKVSIFFVNFQFQPKS